MVGSTGFLGIHLLNQLMHCNIQIYCLIRGTAQQTSLMRLKESYQFYFPEEQIELLFNKVIVLDGDISFPNFKLSKDGYRKLTIEVDTIINAAANVNHIAQKENLTSVNVDGIKNLITLCTFGRAKTLHHISTVGVKGLYKEQHIIFDESMLHVDQIHTEEYSESKYEAELIIHQYMQQGGQANIYRVGTIGPHYHTGFFQKNIEQHFFSRYIHSTIQLGLAGHWHNKILDVTPVDSLATSIGKTQYNLFTRDRVENDLTSLYHSHGLGITAWSPLRSGLLAGRYNNGIHPNSRLAAKENEASRREVMGTNEEERIIVVNQLTDYAQEEFNISLAELALAWCIRNQSVSSAIMGASTVNQIIDNCKCICFAKTMNPDTISNVNDIIINNRLFSARMCDTA